jgi:hypothetical protein
MGVGLYECQNFMSQGGHFPAGVYLLAGREGGEENEK